MATPRLGHSPIKMNLVKSNSDISKLGDFCWYNSGDENWYGKLIPEGCHDLVIALPIKHDVGWTRSLWTIGYKNTGGHQWSWNGNRTSPTLHPSLHAVGIWHGYVKDGQLIEV